MTVRLNDVRKRYGNVVALDGIDAVLDNGITGLLGPNGAGKTTLLRCLATVLAPDSGSIEVLGFDPDRPEERTEIRRRIGYLPQEPGFYRNFTCFDFIDYLAILKEHVDRDQRHAEVRRVLDLTGIVRSVHDQDPQAVGRDEAEVGAVSGAARVSRLSRSSTSQLRVSTPNSGSGSGSWCRCWRRTASCSSPPTRPRTWPPSATG